MIFERSRSPILTHVQEIAAAAFKIAPERADSLQSLVPNFSLQFSNDRGFYIRVRMDTHEAILPIATLEYLWASAYLFPVLYDACASAQARNVTQLDLSADTRVCAAIDLFNWARVNMLESGCDVWPDAFPSPGSTTFDAKVASELFLTGIGWLLHHEIAHVRRKHTRMHRIYAIVQELEADADAVDWVFGACSDPALLEKRQMGLAIALLAMHLLDTPSATEARIGTHPPASERIFTSLEKSRADVDGRAYALVAIVLHWQLLHFGQSIELDGPSFQAIVDGALAAFRIRVG